MIKKKNKKHLQEFITQEEFELIFEESLKLETIGTRKKRRKIKQYRLAILLGFESGLRIGEIVGWNYGKIPKLQTANINRTSIKLIRMCGKERMVPRPKRFSNQAKEMLPFDISRRTLQEFITKMGKDVLNKQIGFQTLRKGFGNHLARKKRPLQEIQRLMGALVKVPEIYKHVNPLPAVQQAREVF